MPDANQTRWQNMHRETPQELSGLRVSGLIFAALAVIAPIKGDGLSLLVHGHAAPVAQGDRCV
jgi:hypothetical protein